MSDTKNDLNWSLEDRMVYAHKQGVSAYRAWHHYVAAEDIQQASAGRFDTPAERMAFIAGYCGAKRRAEQGGL